MPRPITITMDWESIEIAARVGVAREIAAMAQGRQLDRGRTSAWEENIMGAIGEYVVSIAAGVVWHPNVGGNDTATGDIPGRIEVRTTRYPRGRLIVRAKDPPDMAIVLVILKLPRAQIVGQMIASEGRRACWDNEDGSWWVPQHALQPFTRPEQPDARQ